MLKIRENTVVDWLCFVSVVTNALYTHVAVLYGEMKFLKKTKECIL